LISFFPVKKRLYAACALVLAAGIACAAWIWVQAGDGPDLSGAYQIVIVDGVPRAIAPNESKAYMRELQRYGGRMSVIFDDIDRWWSGLWHGRSLALTVASIAVLVSFALYFVAVSLPEPPRDPGAE
jgi:hypothetical protein